MLTTADIEGNSLFPLSQLASADDIPLDIVGFDRLIADLFDQVYYTNSTLEEVENGYLGRIFLVLDQEVALSTLGGTVDLVLGSEGGLSIFEVEINLESRPGGFCFQISLVDVPVVLRFQSGILRPLKPGTLELDPEVGHLEIPLGNVTIRAGTDQALALELTSNISMPQCMIGETGIVIAAESIRWLTPASVDLPENTPEEFAGLYLENASMAFASIELEGSPTLVFDYLFVGQGGVTCRADLQNLNLDGSLFGFEVRLQGISLELMQNSITGGSIDGSLTIPFLEEVVDLGISLSADGDFYAALSQSDENGLFVLDIPFLGSFTLSSLGFATDEEGAVLLLSGILQLEVLSPLLQWPTIELQELRISSTGEIQLPDGWIDLQEPVALDLFGFRIEITRIGFGNTDDGRRWVGFSGGVQLVDFLPTGASVEGLRVTWDPTGFYEPEITLQGVGVELTLPGVLQFDGDVSFFNEESQSYFQGNAKLKLLPLGIELDASIKIGKDLEGGYKFVYTFMGLTLPIGIPLWATGAALYGIAGLYGMNVNPSAENGDWYGWYAGAPEAYNVTHSGKWIGKDDGKALGAGLTVGTLFDVGRVVSVKGLFAIVLPGPIIILHGRANFLSTPPDPSEPGSQGVFNALAVLDALAGNIQLNVDAGWSQAQVIDISASAEAYFDFANPRNWHFYLGQDTPQDRRIRADFIGLFHADAYLMVDSQGIATGAGISWGYDWKFGPVKVILRAWIGAGAVITWQPPQLEGSLRMGGEFEISVAGFGIGLSAEAELSGKAPTLYWVKGSLDVVVKLPTPIKDLDETILLEWKEDAEPEPGDPFKSIGLEHPKVDETWTDVFETDQDAIPGSEGYQPGPLVPLDARPSIVFDRSMHDVTYGRNFSSVNSYPGGEQIGGYKFEYELKEVALEKWSKAGSSSWMPVEDVYGAWMAVEDGNGEPAFTRLQLWAKSPFAFTRQTSRTYRDAFLANHADWPCTNLPEYNTHCVDWEDVEVETRFGPFFERGGLHFALVLTFDAIVAAPDLLSCEMQHALLIKQPWAFLWITFPEPIYVAELCLDGQFAAARAYANGEMVEQILNPEPGAIAFETPGITAIGLWVKDDGLLSRICFLTVADVTAYTNAFEHIMSVYNGLLRWDSQEEILEPETWYRLIVRQEIVSTHNSSTTRTPTDDHYAYFHTGGPPGLILDAPNPSESDPDENTPVPYPLGGKLTDLKEYIQWTIPGDGEQPVYRAYDLGADFNENYVEQMYGADMVIRLLDANAQPIRDAEGNEIQFPNQWGEKPTAELSETEYPYTNRVEDCLTLPIYAPSDQNIIFANGVMLEEDFSGDLEQWSDPHPEDGGEWVIAGGQIIYSNILFPALGALLVAGKSTWSDYAVEMTLSDPGEDVGVACRYSNGDVEAYYRLRLNASGRFLEKIVDGEVTVLWQDGVSYTPGASTKLALQCQGARLRGQLDGELMFDIRDEAALLSGQVGLFTNATAAFEHFLVRAWPGSALAPQTAYRADLMASHVLFSDNLEGGWITGAYSWVALYKDNARITAIGHPDWANYRVEVNAFRTGPHTGLIARFVQDAANETFTCYRLFINADDEVILQRLEGTYDGSFYELTDAGRSKLWSCRGAACDVDFDLDAHALALTCDGEILVVEIDGNELARVPDPNGPSAGKAGLYYIGADAPEFSDLVVRSAPRQPVYGWQFVTSRYAGFVDHMDSFQGLAYREEVSQVDTQRLEDASSTAAAEMSAAAQAVEDNRALLASAGPEEVTTRRQETQAAVAAWQTTAAAHYETLYLELLGNRYRPLPPVVEISHIVSDVQSYALLMESPEPLDWKRLRIELRVLDNVSDTHVSVEEILAVWNHDGARAIIIPADGSMLVAGEYELQLDYSLDIGLEAPLLRLGGSTLPEIAKLRFTIQ